MKKIFFLIACLLLGVTVQAQPPAIPVLDLKRSLDRLQDKFEEGIKWTEHHLPMMANIKSTAKDMNEYWKMYKKTQEDLRIIKDVANLRFMKPDELAKGAFWIAGQKMGIGFGEVGRELPYALGIEQHMKKLPTAANAAAFYRFANTGSSAFYAAADLESMVKANAETFKKKYSAEVANQHTKLQIAMQKYQEAEQLYQDGQELSTAINTPDKISATPYERLMIQREAKKMMSEATDKKLEAIKLYHEALQQGEYEGRMNQAKQNKMWRDALSNMKVGRSKTTTKQQLINNR